MAKKENKRYILTYSIYDHAVFGYVIEPYAVELNKNGQPTLNYMRVYSHTVSSYIEDYDELDETLLEIMDDYSLEALGKKFGKKNKKKPTRPTEFVQNMQGNELENYIIPFIKKKVDNVLSLMSGKKDLYLKGKNDNPLQKYIYLPEDPVNIVFHFKKQEDGIRYYPTIKHKDKLVTYTNNESKIICYEPCWFLVGDHLYHFDRPVEGKKIEPFIDKPVIFIPKKHEETYLNKFVFSLIEKYPVKTHGFPVKEVSPTPNPLMQLGTNVNTKSWCLFIGFSYRDKNFYPGEKRERFARLSKDSDTENRIYEIELVYRNYDKEYEILDMLEKFNLKKGQGASFYIKRENGEYPGFEDYIEWINLNYNDLKEHDFDIEYGDSENEYFIGNAELEFSVQDKKDWFDINAIIRFGNHEVPFYKLKEHLLNGIREYTLPDGKIAILPQEWFSKYKDLFIFGGIQKNSDKIRIKKYHFNLLPKLPGSKNGKRIELQQKLEKYDDSSNGNNIEPPKELKADLRTYQLQGLTWLSGLQDIGLGGCLADDMGLGKTVQTLSILTKLKEDHIKANESYPPSLIVMPASLIHNWRNEIRKFTPKLSSFVYTGAERRENQYMIPRVDIIITTYGTVRNDIDELEEYYFSYIILDESQNIKNPNSKIAKAVKKLSGENKLVLTGTPIENTLTDLWSQMNFANPGLLGGYNFFKNEYVIPIEKHHNEDAQNKLKRLISPFIMRRTKDQVATELPTLTQKTHFCEMTEEQSKEYEKIKSSYRNQIFKNIEEYGIRKSQFMILRGLTQLRLLANHPRLLDAESEATSGKFDEVINMLESVMEENHKVLIYSQFVKHLNIFKNHFEKTGISYSYFVGNTKNREEVLDDFINNEEKQVILISLKAGGAGLNLMAADYVFLLDPWWNPAVEQQAINRAHRIGQDKKVFSYRFITKNSIEEKIMQLQNKKASLSDSLITPTQGLGGNLELEDVRALLQ